MAELPQDPNEEINLTTEVVQKPNNPQTTHLFVDLATHTFVAGKPIEGILVLVVQKAVQIQRIALAWKGLEHVSWSQGTTEQKVSGTEWWVARRLFLFPDDGTSAKDQTFEPGAYTFPFTTVLRVDLPGSYEVDNTSNREEDPTTAPDKNCIRYTVTGQCDIVLPNKSIGKITATKSFSVVESFDPQILFEQAAVRKAQNNFFFGGPLIAMLWVANKGNILFGTPLHIKVDILNKSPFLVEKVVLSIWEHKVLQCLHQNQAKVLKLSSKIQETIVNQSQTPSGIEKTKIVKLPFKGTHPSLTKGKLISVSYELIARYVYMMDFIELKVPLKVFGTCQQLAAELPIIPVNIHNDRAQELHAKQCEEVEIAGTW